MMLTSNEKHVLRLLAAHVGKEYSINEIARRSYLSPNGTFKMLVKFEKEGVLKEKKIANIKDYKLNFMSEKTMRVLELAFMPDILEERIKRRADDLQRMRKITQACILFGSYITMKKNPNDLDILFILEQKNFVMYKHMLNQLQNILPLKIQDVVQTTDDLQQNIKMDDPLITAVLQQGVVLWGFGVLAGVIKNVSQ